MWICLFLFCATRLAAYEKAPYLIYEGVNTEMTVLWQIDGSQPCRISWGLDESYSLSSVITKEYGSSHQHKYAVSDLIPGEKYFYKVVALVGVEGEFQEIDIGTGSFLAAPSEDATDLKFFVCGDTRGAPAELDVVCAQMINTYTNRPDFQTFNIHTGDWSDRGQEDKWDEEFFGAGYVSKGRMLSEVPFQGCWGNHEDNGVVYGKYYPYPYVSEGYDQYWSFDYGPAHIAVVDMKNSFDYPAAKAVRKNIDLTGVTTSYKKGSAQNEWLKKDLASSDKPWKFVIHHMPAYSSEANHGSDVFAQEHLQPLYEEYDVDIVFSGHNHYYAHSEYNGVKHIVAGGGGAGGGNPVMSPDWVKAIADGYSFCEIEISGETLTLVCRSEAGKVLDSFRLTHAKN